VTLTFKLHEKLASRRNQERKIQCVWKIGIVEVLTAIVPAIQYGGRRCIPPPFPDIKCHMQAWPGPLVAPAAPAVVRAVYTCYMHPFVLEWNSRFRSRNNDFFYPHHSTKCLRSAPRSSAKCSLVLALMHNRYIRRRELVIHTQRPFHACTTFTVVSS
jgi:hypothetical protein